MLRWNYNIDCGTCVSVMVGCQTRALNRHSATNKTWINFNNRMCNIFAGMEHATVEKKPLLFDKKKIHIFLLIDFDVNKTCLKFNAIVDFTLAGRESFSRLRLYPWRENVQKNSNPLFCPSASRCSINSIIADDMLTCWELSTAIRIEIMRWRRWCRRRRQCQRTNWNKIARESFLLSTLKMSNNEKKLNNI